MANLTATNVDLGSVILKGGTFRDELLTFAAADVTVLEGTILARDSVTGKAVPFVVNATLLNENNIPKSVLTYDVTSTAIGDVAIRALTSGELRKERLVIDEDGDGSSITDVILDQLRDYGITASNVKELNIEDNQ